MNIAETIRRLPKLEQHVHIVGSTRPETLLWIIEDSGAQSDLRTLEDVEKFYNYEDFPHFIQVYGGVNDLITKEEYYELITYELLRSERDCSVRHVEAIFSANDHVRRGMSYAKMLDAINRGIAKGESDFGVTCSIRVDLVRNYGPAKGLEILDWIREKGENVVAVDIGGSEEGFPPEPYAEVYEKARGMGLRLVAHAGEAAGVASVRGAVEALGVERIGHGVAAASDPFTMRLLADRGVAVECCPVSNLRTGAIRRLQDHPIRAFIARGIRVSVNSDDPPMFGTDMLKEYEALHRDLGFTPRELGWISLDAVASSFLPEPGKRQLYDEFNEEISALLG